MAGVPVRSRRESLFREMPVGSIESAMDGICDVGMVPPPVVAVEVVVVMFALVMEPSWLMMWSALAWRFSMGSARFLSVGMSV